MCIRDRPGDTLTEMDENGWYVKDFTCTKAGSYNIIVSDTDVYKRQMLLYLKMSFTVV